MQEPKVVSVTDPMVDSMVSALRAFIEAFPRRRSMMNAQYEALYSAKCRAQAALGPDGGVVQRSDRSVVRSKVGTKLGVGAQGGRDGRGTKQ